MRRRRRVDLAGRPSLALLAVPLILAASPGCSTPRTGVAGASPVVVHGRAPAVTQRRLPLLYALENAVVDGADDVARRLLERLAAEPLTADERLVVARYELVLDGRELTDALELELVTRGLDSGALELVLVARSRSADELVLRLPPADLEHLRVTVDARGVEDRVLATRPVDALGDLRLVPGVPVALVLADVEPRLGRALAARDTWRLTLRAGEVEHDGRVFPAARLPRPRLELGLLGDGSGTGSPLGDRAVRGADFVDDVARALGEPGDDLDALASALLRRAVRVPPDQREVVLRGLVPVLASYADATPAKARALTPALRWVARTRDPLLDVESWLAWVDGWVQREDARRREQELSGGLDLPEGPIPAEPLPAERGGLDLR